MRNTLNQKKNFVKRELRFTESKLYYNVSKFGNGNEVDIPFENINGEKVSFKTSNNILLIFSMILYLIAIIVQVSYFRGGKTEMLAGVIWAGVATIVLLVYWFSRENFWKIRLANDTYIFVHKNIPSDAATEAFLNDLIKSRNKYLVENYAIIDENLTYESQLSNLKWLKGINALSKSEFDNKYVELKTTLKQNKTHIGFGK